MARDLRPSDLIERGFVQLPLIVDGAEVAELASALDRLLAEDLAQWGAARLDAIGQRGAIRNLVTRGVEFERLLGCRAIHQLARATIGEDYILHAYDGLVLEAGVGRFPWDFHTDLHDLRDIQFPRGVTPGINALIAVDRSEPGNGATWIVPGSHASPHTHLDSAGLTAAAVQPTLEAGDILIFDARLWHCAGNNDSTQSRRLIKIEFTLPWIKQQFDFARVRSDLDASRLNRDARRCLGEPLPISFSDHWLRLEKECESTSVLGS